MARTFLDDLRAKVQLQIPDNIAGLVSPADVRGNMIDIIDSCVQDEAGLGSSTQAAITVNLTDTWVSIDDLLDPPVIAYDTVVGGDANFLKVDQAAGTITSTNVAGYSYEALGALTVNSANNEVVEAAIGLDGVPGDLVGSNVGAAGVRPESIFLRRYITSTPADSAFSVIIRAPDGSANNVEITGRTFGLIILPTNNP